MFLFIDCICGIVRHFNTEKLIFLMSLFFSLFHICFPCFRSQTSVQFLWNLTEFSGKSANIIPRELKANKLVSNADDTFYSCGLLPI